MKFEDMPKKSQAALRKVWSNLPNVRKPKPPSKPKKQRTKEQRRKASLRAKYKISESDYMLLNEVQGGLCAICGRKPSGKRPVLCIDHCHKTGRIRGLLCMNCNSGLGYFHDNPERMQKAARYLMRSVHGGKASDTQPHLL
jgi:hypothetical protein